MQQITHFSRISQHGKYQQEALTAIFLLLSLILLLNRAWVNGGSNYDSLKEGRYSFFKYYYYYYSILILIIFIYIIIIFIKLSVGKRRE